MEVDQPMQAELVTADEAVWPDRPDGNPATGPLAGLRVLDLTAYAVGPWAACNLAQLGADVVRVDPPYGDPIRAVLPRKHGEPTTYMSTSLGKRSMILNLKDPADHRLVRRMAAAADVVLENSRAGTMERLGLGYDELSAANPGLIYCSSSSYGDAGPMASMGSTDPQGQAFSGFASHNGHLGGRPEVLRYVALVDLGTSMQLLNAVLIALAARRRSGVGQHLRTSQMEAAIGLQITRFAEFFASGNPGMPLGSGTRGMVPSRAYLCSDGAYIALTAATDDQWASLCTILTLGSGLSSIGAAERVTRRDEIDAAVATAVAARPAAWWTQVLARHSIPCARQRTLDDKPEELAHIVENGLVRRVRHPVEGTLAVAGPVWSFERTTPQLGDPEPPGRHHDELMAALARPTGDTLVKTAADGSEHSQDDATAGRPLAGVRVVDLTQGVSGPYCSHLLATLGAEVTKIEPPGGDWLRGVGGPQVDGSSATFYALARGKRSVVLDLEDPAGDEALRRILRSSDVLLHDFTADEAERRRLAPSQLRGLNPSIVDCSVTAYGERGPWSELPATELEVQATAGVWRYLGVIGEHPVRIGADLTGVLGGCAAFQAVLAALVGDDAKGQHVATSQLAAVTGANTVMIAALDQPDAWEGFHTNAATYPPDHGIATADGQIYYGQPLRSEQAWVEFCQEIGADELLDVPEFATREQRMPNQMMLRRALQPFFERIPTAELIEKVVRSDGIAVPVQSVDEVVSHPQIKALEIVVEATHTRALSAPWRAADGSLRPLLAAAPAVGADTAAVLAEHGFSPDEVRRLVDTSASSARSAGAADPTPEGVAI
jgi:crotonobetainyl-CoA:carnitine CoA-transferase CaiB-like acyl-CoA transferase